MIVLIADRFLMRSSFLSRGWGIELWSCFLKICMEHIKSS